MKRTVFYVCPDCGNIFTASVEAGITCCGKKLTPLQAKNAAEEDRLSVEQVGDEYYISSDDQRALYLFCGACCGGYGDPAQTLSGVESEDLSAANRPGESSVVLHTARSLSPEAMSRSAPAGGAENFGRRRRAKAALM